MNTEFENIEAYSPGQFREALLRIIHNSEFRHIVEGICHYQMKDSCTADEIILPLNEVHDLNEFDDVLIIRGLKNLAAKACNGLQLRGAENLALPALLLSNHRDIILDAAFLSVLIKDLTGKRIYFGAGTNLYVQSWVEDMLRINHGFSVIRGGTVHEMMRNSLQLSSYIRHLITNERAGVWLAQREGRAKNSDDRTQPALLKMLAMSGGKNFIESLKELNITPVAICYEYDPCDYLKAQEMQLRRDNAEWKKTPQDDFVNMRTGLLGWKGQTVFTIAQPINQFLDGIEAQTTNRNEQVTLVAELIDRLIHTNYCIYNVNRIAYDLYLNTDKFSEDYSDEEKAAFENYIDSRIALVDIADKDTVFLREKLLEMYSFPLVNQLEAHKSSRKNAR
ncbi:MAG: acyltransferase [Paludibacteraceae bacterium]|nr:acyltransferase [Paludibacteraceae bacterium]